MVNPVTTFGTYFIRTEIHLPWAEKLLAAGRQKLDAIINSDYFWMAASFGLLITIDWALKHALLALVEFS